MTLPPQLPKIYIEGTQKAHDLLLQLNATVRDGFNAFWADPIGQAVPMNAEARASGITAEGIFRTHGAIIGAIAAVIPYRLAWFGDGPPVEVPFLTNGDIDIPALTVLWESYLATLPNPEPEEVEA